MSDYIQRFSPLWEGWQVDRLLGEGSYGKVWQMRCEDSDGTHYAAVKEVVIPPTGNDLATVRAEGMDAECAKFYFKNLLEETLKEVELMQKLAYCSNVVQYEDYQVKELNGEDEFGWVIFMRMERLVPFKEYMLEKGMDAKDVQKLGIHMCHALEACLQQGIVHRDIKPDNLFYCPETDSYKLGDFGIAHYLARPTQGKGRAGTLTHMTPEVYQGALFTPEADLYALGMILYRLMNDNRIPLLPPYPVPFSPVQRNEALVRRLRGEEPNCPRILTMENQDSFSLELGKIVHKAISAKRENRFASASELREALETIRDEGGSL